MTGKTVDEILADVSPYPDDQQVIRSFDNPIKRDSHLVILRGNLAPDGAVAKITGHEGLRFTGTSRCFHGEEAAMAAILDGTVVPGDVVVVRYEGPRGGPGATLRADALRWHRRPPRYHRLGQDPPRLHDFRLLPGVNRPLRFAPTTARLRPPAS